MMTVIYLGPERHGLRPRGTRAFEQNRFPTRAGFLDWGTSQYGRNSMRVFRLWSAMTRDKYGITKVKQND